MIKMPILAISLLISYETSQLFFDRAGHPTIRAEHSGNITRFYDFRGVYLGKDELNGNYVKHYDAEGHFLGGDNVK